MKNNSSRQTELRAWYMKNPCESLGFFEGYRWLEKGIEEGDLGLRKSIMNRLYGLFRTPQDALEWIKNGTIPPYLEEENSSVLDKIMEVDEDEKLRMWCMEHRSTSFCFFEQYKLLKEADEKGRELLKFCILHEYLGVFKTPVEALEWIKTGITPIWVLEKREESRGTDSPG